MHDNMVYDRKTPPQPIRRKPGSRLPCGTCPKFGERERDRGPVAGSLRDLNWQNQQTLRAFYEARGANLPVTDALTIRRFGIIARIMDRTEYRQRQTASDLLIALVTRGPR